MKRRHHGQEILEFALISGLVFIVGIGTVMTFGDKIAGFFEGNPATLVAENKPGELLTVVEERTTVPDLNGFKAYKEEIVAGETLRVFDDGHVEAVIGGDAFTLDTRAIGAINTAMESNGTAGLEDLVAELAYLVKTYGVKPEDVEVWAGGGQRDFSISYNDKEKKGLTGFFGNSVETKNASASVKGKAKFESTIVNAFALKADNHIIIIQKDQTCSGEFCPFQGTYRIEGDVDENNNFVANFTNDKEGIEGTYATKVSTSSGLVFEKSTYEQNKEYKSCYTKKVRTGMFKKKNKTFCNTASSIGNWGLNFLNTNLKFEL